jgi:uncharacterized RDD family membrane protein YckC
VIQRASPERLVGLQGTYAGFMTRLGGCLIDLLVIAGLFALAGQAVEYLVSALFGGSFELSEMPVVSGLALAGWALFYCAYPLAVGGRTFGMAVVGLRAVRADGRDLTTGRAVLRVLAFPLSFLLFGFGFLLVLLKRDRRALHDLVAGSAVVYAWDARAARLRFLARNPSA